jgi:hypothetical protein
MPIRNWKHVYNPADEISIKHTKITHCTVVWSTAKITSKTYPIIIYHCIIYVYCVMPLVSKTYSNVTALMNSGEKWDDYLN